MGKELELFVRNGVVTFLSSTGMDYRAEITDEGGVDFLILQEILNPLEDDERDTGEIAGYEVLDIDTIKASDIPDITETYDIPEMGIKDMTIKEIVMLVKKELSKEAQHRKTA